MSKHVVVLGGGFAGVTLTKQLFKQNVQITLIDRRNYSLFQPLLYQVATGALQSEAIAMSLRRWIKNRNLRHLWGEVSEIDMAGKCIALSNGISVPYDLLCIAVGTQTNFFENAQIERHALQLKSIEEAERVRSHIFSELERACACEDTEKRRAHLTFAIAGGGPTGVEFAVSILETLHRLVSQEYPELSGSEIRVVLVQGGDALLPGFAPELQAAALGKLQRLGAHIRFQTHVTGFDGSTVACDSGANIETNTLVWTAGVTAPDLIGNLPVKKGHGNRLIVDAHLRLSDFPEVFVLGDLAQSEDSTKIWPQVAPFALQTARHVAAVIKNTVEESKKELKPFRYLDPGSMVFLGHYDAVCQIDRWHLHWRGKSAWLLWIGLHLYRIMGLRNRLLTLIDWGRDYLRNDNAVEIIRHPTQVGCGDSAHLTSESNEIHIHKASRNEHDSTGS